MNAMHRQNYHILRNGGTPADIAYYFGRFWATDGVIVCAADWPTNRVLLDRADERDPEWEEIAGSAV